MFLAPVMRVPWSWAGAAFLIGGLVFSYPLARTSSLDWMDGQIMMRRSRLRRLHPSLSASSAAPGLEPQPTA